MLRLAIPALFALSLFPAVQQTFQANGRIERVDAEGSVLRVFANGRSRTVGVAVDARILDREGKPLAGGLKAKELSPGADVTLVLQPGNGGPVIREIRLGANAGGGQAAAIPRVDTSTFVPLTALGEKQYKGFPGGLYPGGKNDCPPPQEAAGLALAKTIRPLDASGQPSAQGRIVLLSVGMSNTTQEFSTFKQRADADSKKNPQLTLVDGAQGAMTAQRIQDPESSNGGSQYWSVVDDRLRQAGVTRAQVQVAWIKEADAGPTQGLPAYARTLQAELGRIARLMHTRFPNLKLVYLSSRIYGGYARTPLNPEPYAYESGFSVKWLIEQQLKGDADLNFDPRKGAVKAPWLAWGPYLWANGTTARADGLSYAESDLGPDGTHPSEVGRRKVAEQLWKFFTTDPTAKGWFLR